MLQTPSYVKQYRSAQERFLKPALMAFFRKSTPALSGHIMAAKMADEIITLFDRLCPERESIEIGQVLWNALDKNTRGDSPNRRLVPVVLTLVAQEDIDSLLQGTPHHKIAQKAIARMTTEAFEQGGIMSTRDLALIALRDESLVSRLRREYETINNVTLPHTGVLHDMGSCLTHKKQIVYKVVVEKKDPTLVAQETNHSQKAVDSYVHNYYRVKTAYETNTDIDFICFVTGLSKRLITQYIQLYEEFKLKD